MKVAPGLALHPRQFRTAGEGRVRVVASTPSPRRWSRRGRKIEPCILKSYNMVVLNTWLDNELNLTKTLVVRGSDPPSGRHCVPIHVDPDTPRVGAQYTLADCGPIQLDWYVSTKK